MLDKFRKITVTMEFVEMLFGFQVLEKFKV